MEKKELYPGSVPTFLSMAGSSSASPDYQRQRQMTVADLLLDNRVMFLQGAIYDGNANE